jgi:hypothetical protein
MVNALLFWRYFPAHAPRYWICMAISSFDTHNYFKQLTTSGIAFKHAEAHTKALTTFMSNELVRRSDLIEFKSEIRFELGEFKAEMKSNFDEFKSEIRFEFSEFKAEMKSNFDEFKSEIRFDFSEFKSDIKMEMDKRFDDVYQKFDAINKRFDTIDQKFDAIDQKFYAIDTRFAGMQGQLDLLKWMMGFTLTGVFTILFKLFL